MTKSFMAALTSDDCPAALNALNALGEARARFGKAARSVILMERGDTLDYIIHLDTAGPDLYDGTGSLLRSGVADIADFLAAQTETH